MITPIDREDQIMGMKSGGPIANAMGGGRGTGGNVNISINGGDERRVSSSPPGITFLGWIHRNDNGSLSE